MIRKLASGEYRLYSRKKNAKTGKRRNLGTFKSRQEAEQHEREIQFSNVTDFCDDSQALQCCCPERVFEKFFQGALASLRSMSRTIPT